MKTKAIILHGWAYDKSKWLPFLSALKDIGVDVDFPDIPGLTSSLDHPFNMDNYLDWLDSYIDKSNAPVILIGHSNGGRIAGFYTSKFPEKIAALILIDSAGMIDKKILNQIKLRSLERISKIIKFLFGDSVILKEIGYRAIGVRDYNEANPIMKETMRNLLSADLSTVANKITAETLIIWGQNDKETPLHSGEEIQKLINNSRCVVIHGAGHSPQFTHVNMVVKHISEFLTDIGHI